MSKKIQKEIECTDNDIIDVTVIESNDNIPVVYNESSLQDDFKAARDNIYNILEVSDDVLDAAVELAIETEHPRMIEVYSGLVKNLSDINMSLLKLRESKVNIEDGIPDIEDNSTTNVTNNSVFVGSTEELLKAINAKPKEDTKDNKE